ncbi:MAG: hypothetical protein HXX14_14020 [Bacteroidetes bacterium]|nr:hypothetical protein [Bacteroidota bacterium]
MIKDIIIKAKTIKQELWVFFGVFIFAFCLNIYAILHYKTQWKELYTHIHIVVLLAVGLYVILLLLRSIFCIIKRGIKKKV